jgi:hypothetical protein
LLFNAPTAHTYILARSRPQYKTYVVDNNNVEKTGLLDAAGD